MYKFGRVGCIFDRNRCVKCACSKDAGDEPASSGYGWALPITSVQCCKSCAGGAARREERVLNDLGVRILLISRKRFLQGCEGCLNHAAL